MAARQRQKQDLPATIQYEDFVPRCEWNEEPEATLLLLHLPGFSKEEIKVTYIHSSRTIRITGQRPVTVAGPDAKRWSRFNQAFPVPQNCLVDAIYGNFKNGVLTIAMPKQNIINPELDNIPDGSGKEKETSQKLPEASSGRAETTFSPPKPPPMISSREEGKGKTEEKKLVEESKGKKEVPELEERKLPETSYTKPVSGTDLGLEKKKKEKGIIEKIRAKEMTNEDKKLLVNMGVAAVVIFALGAYVSYTLSSSSSSSSSPSSSSSSSTSSSSSSKPE